MLEPLAECEPFEVTVDHVLGGFESVIVFEFEPDGQGRAVGRQDGGSHVEVKAAPGLRTLGLDLVREMLAQLLDVCRAVGGGESAGGDMHSRSSVG